MERFILLLMALGVIVGGADACLGDRFGLGKKFREGFETMGSVALSMTGVICLAPMLTDALSHTIAPLLESVGLDPAVLGGVLAIDMGGYHLAQALASSPAFGTFCGVAVSATLGCTLSFSIPVGFSTVAEKDQIAFARGILLGLLALPAGLIPGGLVCGVPIGVLLKGLLPVGLLIALLMMGFVLNATLVIRVVRAFGRGVQLVATVGLVLAAVWYLTGWRPLARMAPIEEALKIVTGIGITMLGSLPLAELLRRALKKPLARLCGRIGLDHTSVTGLLVSLVSVTPGIAMMREMDERGKTVNAAVLVSTASLLAAHMGFTVTAAPDMLAALFVSKLAGGAAALALALAATRKYCSKTPDA